MAEGLKNEKKKKAIKRTFRRKKKGNLCGHENEIPDKYMTTTMISRVELPIQ